jgi:hypothetical protein
MFGEQASKAEIVLDEYEKSVFLTQTQDQIVKSYFDIRSDSLQEGFDGSERRQVDFSSLITVKTLYPYNNTNVVNSSGDFLGKVAISSDRDIKLIINYVHSYSGTGEVGIDDNVWTVTIGHESAP